MSGHKKGEYKIIEPHDDLNMSRSTNDSYPTAIKVAFICNEKLISKLEKLAAAFRKKADAYISVVKMRRTELQDAVPMTVGQEFHAFAASLETEIGILREAEKQLSRSIWAPQRSGQELTCPRDTPKVLLDIWQN
jgi:aspartate ammonia-lyase